MRSARLTILAAALAATVACGPSDDERDAMRAQAIETVERFGAQLVRVDLTAGAQQVGNAAREAYGPYVTTLQLGTWMSDLSSVPGRRAPSPFPARIEVRDAVAFGNSAYDVTGDIVYVATVDGDPVLREPVRIRVVRGPDDIWRISEWNSDS